MDLESILKLPEYQLPAAREEGKTFIAFYEATIKNYISLVKNSPDLFAKSKTQFLEHREFYEKVENIGLKIIEMIRTNNRGDNINAYKAFKHMMKNDAALFLNNYPGATFFVNRKDCFFRSRYPNAADKKEASYFFHTPFNLSDKVKATRFSPQGFPSLYLSNALIVGYLETRAESLTNFQGVKMQPSFPLSFLNLEYNNPDESLKTSDEDQYNTLLQVKGLIFPLLFACFCQVNDPTSAAPHEYIIPQFLTRWVTDHNKVFSGIKYPSTRVSGDNYKRVFYNLIIPPKEVCDEGFCPILKMHFRMSDVCSAEADKAELEKYFDDEFTKINVVNKDIDTIEWDSKPVRYEECPVGKMEFYVRNKLDAKNIAF